MSKHCNTCLPNPLILTNGPLLITAVDTGSPPTVLQTKCRRSRRRRHCR